MLRWFTTIIGSLTMAGCSLVGIRTTPEPPSEVIQKDGAIEVRQYQPQVLAETWVDKDYDDAGSAGFRRIAGYIFGGNQARQSIAMTAPVLQQERPETIAMTAPVLQQETDKGWWMAFILPEDITLANAPTPDDSRVLLREIPAQKVATLRYGGLNSPEKMASNAALLENWLKEHDYQVVGDAMMASYDPPWTLWFARRNEVQFKLR